MTGTMDNTAMMPGLRGDFTADGRQRITFVDADLSGHRLVPLVFESSAKRIWGQQDPVWTDAPKVIDAILERRYWDGRGPDDLGAWSTMIFERIPRDRAWKIELHVLDTKVEPWISAYLKHRFTKHAESRLLCNALDHALDGIVQKSLDVVPVHVVVERSSVSHFRVLSNVPIACAIAVDTTQLVTPWRESQMAHYGYVNVGALIHRPDLAAKGLCRCDTSALDTLSDAAHVDMLLRAHAVREFAEAHNVPTQLSVDADHKVRFRPDTPSASITVDSDWAGVPRGYFGGMEWVRQTVETANGREGCVLAVDVDRRPAPSLPEDFDVLLSATGATPKRGPRP